MSMKQMTMTIETVSPETAAEWLALNIGNRRIRKGWVLTLTSRINRGEWMLSHQGVAFNQSGRLCDGQHRLSAIIQSGIPTEIAVFRDVPDDSFKVLDQGAKRTNEDISGMDKRVVEPINLASRVKFGNHFSYQQFDVILNTELGELACELVEKCGTTTKTYSAAPMKLAAIIRASEGEKEKQFAFSLYQTLVYLDFEKMPPAAQSFVRQVHSERVGAFGNSSSNDLLARALIVFDPTRRDLKKVVATPEIVRRSLEFVRSRLDVLIASSELT